MSFEKLVLSGVKDEVTFNVITNAARLASVEESRPISIRGLPERLADFDKACDHIAGKLLVIMDKAMAQNR